jgi:hypothetical protein
MATELPGRNRSTGQRWADACIGALFVGCAATILALFPLSDWKAMLAAAALFGLGLDALHAAWRPRRSLLSRIGPLP